MIGTLGSESLLVVLVARKDLITTKGEIIMTERKILFTDYSGRDWTEKELNDTLKSIRSLAENLRFVDWF